MVQIVEERKMISSGELAKIIGKSERTIQLLAKAGDLTCEKNKNKNSYNLYTVIKEYIEYLAKREVENFSSLDEEKIHEEIRFKRAKADMMELELKELVGEMHSAEDVESMTTDLILAVRSSLLSLPGRIGVDVAELKTASECSEVIKKAVYEILEDLSYYEYTPEKYQNRVRERQGWKEKMGEQDGRQSTGD